nr:putative transcriptional regulatory protein [Quercus suber]
MDPYVFVTDPNAGQSNSLISSSAEMPGRLTRQASSSRSTQSQAQSADQPTMVTISAENLRNIENRVETLTQMVRNLQAQGSSGQGSIEEQSGIDATIASIVDSDSLASITGHLSLQDGQRVRYVEPTFWATMSNEVSGLEELIGNQIQDTMRRGIEDHDFSEDDPREESAGQVDSSSPPIHMYDYDAMLGTISAQPLTSRAAWAPYRRMRRGSAFFRDFPPRERCDILIEAYIKGYHPIVPIIHVPSFRKRYDEFWIALETPSARSTASLPFAALIAALAYGGLVACPDCLDFLGGPQELAKDRVNALHKLVVRALRIASFPRAPTLDTYRAYLICQMSCLRSEEPLTCVAFVGLALRVGTMLGLHKDPSHFPGIPPIEAEVRRRVWWTLVYTDTQVAVASGLPPVIELSSWDVREVSELKEEYIGTSVGIQYENSVREGTRLPDSADNPHFETVVTRRTLYRLLSGKPLSTDEVLSLRKNITYLFDELKARIARISEPLPGMMGESHLGATYSNNPAFNRFARLLLSAKVDDMYCLVCHPMLKSSVFQIWESLYSQNHQPLHALMIILLDLIESPGSPAAPRSRDIVDCIFALSGPDGGLVAGAASPETMRDRPLTEGGSRTWEYFRRLRIKAWQTSGLDSSQLRWTREQAVRHYNNAPELDIAPPDLAYRSQIGLESPEGAQSSENEGREFMSPPDVILSPPFIDWDYLDAVLEGRQDEMVVDPNEPPDIGETSTQRS